MSYKGKRWYRSRRCQIVIFVFAVIIFIYYLAPPKVVEIDYLTQSSGHLSINANGVQTNNHMVKVDPHKHGKVKGKKKNGFVREKPKQKTKSSTVLRVNRTEVIEIVEKTLQNALKEDKGTGCNMPVTDPFAKEITDLENPTPDVKCKGLDWVKCYQSECRVVDEILKTTTRISCTYKDILYIKDSVSPKLGHPTVVVGDNVYKLSASDHVQVSCTGLHLNNIFPSKWTGYSLGFRPLHKPVALPTGFQPVNVLILGFDSTSRNGFIRRMPKSYKYLTEKMDARILMSYNIVGDGTPAALFPILTGKTELEYPDVRKSVSNKTLDFMPFIFYKLKEEGYRTAYFEDMPWIGTFQYRFNGFSNQPADHYLRAFFIQESGNGKSFWGKSNQKYCVGDTMRCKLMLNITDQFFEQDGKKFCFTFIADITHDDFNMISLADNALKKFLTKFKNDGRLEDTMLFLMGDHGSRFSKVRNTIQGKLEERMPLMAVILPEVIKRARPEALQALDSNVDVLTTPHDIYATILDAMSMRQHWNHYKVPGADLKRGNTLLEPIPSNRSCSEAGIEPHWCACVAWTNISSTEPVYQQAGQALVDYINSLTEPVRSLCAARSLRSVQYVLLRAQRGAMLGYRGALDPDGYLGWFQAPSEQNRRDYQLKIEVGPGLGVYEASIAYYVKDNTFKANTRDISRINAYGNEPACISDAMPHLNMYCYCNN